MGGGVRRAPQDIKRNTKRPPTTTKSTFQSLYQGFTGERPRFFPAMASPSLEKLDQNDIVAASSHGSIRYRAGTRGYRAGTRARPYNPDPELGPRESPIALR